MYKWNADHRRRLAENLGIVVRRLWEVGFTGEMGVDGSFVKACLRPRDIDVYCIMTEEEVERHYVTRLDMLNSLEGSSVWAFTDEERVNAPGFRHAVSPLCAKYGVDLQFDWGQPSGIAGPDGKWLLFRHGFRQSREFYRSKGVIRIVPDHSVGSPSINTRG